MNFKRLVIAIWFNCFLLGANQYAYSQNMLEQMKELHLKKANGSITSQQFEEQKKAIIESHNPATKRQAEEKAIELAQKQEQEKKLQEKKNALLPIFKTIQTAPIAEINRAIDQGADVNAVDKDGLSVLMLAAANCDNPKIIELLVSKGADINARVRISIIDDTYITVLTSPLS